MDRTCLFFEIHIFLCRRMRKIYESSSIGESKRLPRVGLAQREFEVIESKFWYSKNSQVMECNCAIFLISDIEGDNEV